MKFGELSDFSSFFVVGGGLFFVVFCNGLEMDSMLFWVEFCFLLGREVSGYEVGDWV